MYDVYNLDANKNAPAWKIFMIAAFGAPMSPNCPEQGRTRPHTRPHTRQSIKDPHKRPASTPLGPPNLFNPKSYDCFRY